MLHMYENAATQENMATLKRRGFTFIEADEGYLACGDVGKGRMADPDIIVAAVLKKLDEITDTTGTSTTLDLAGKHIMITAGPTVEPIDPVRYLTNRSSGKFGYAIAEAAAKRGAKVTLISGPVALPAPENVEVVYIETAKNLLEACKSVFPQVDAALFAAAVADMRPANAAEQKLKKGVNDKELSNIELIENPDVLATLGHAKSDQIVVGFAAETNDVIDYATKKLVKKNADMIVANEVGAKKTFGEDHDEIWLVTAEGTEHHDRATKAELAHVILDKVKDMMD